MRIKLILTLVAIVLVTALVVGCGGGGSPPEGGGDGKTQGGGVEGGKTQAERESASGTVLKVAPENNKFVLEPSEGEPLTILVKENAEITLDGEDATPEDVSEGQTVEVEYITKPTKKGETETKNVARVVKLTAAKEGTG